MWNMRVEFYKKGNPSPSNEFVGKDPYKPVDYLDLVSQVKVERVLRMPFKGRSTTIGNPTSIRPKILTNYGW